MFATILLPARLCLTCLLLLLASRGLAQTPFNHSPNTAKEGYWRLHTDYAQSRTRVQFLDGNEQLLYEEILPGQYVKLTPRMRRRLDQLLVNLLHVQQQQVLANRIPTYLLKRPNTRTAPQLEKPLATAWVPVTPKVSAEPKGGLQVSPVTLPDQAQFAVQLLNPAREKIWIRLHDKQPSNVHWGTVCLYYEETAQATYAHVFSVRQLPAGYYQLSVQSRSHRYSYQLLVSEQPAGNKIAVFAQ